VCDLWVAVRYLPGMAKEQTIPKSYIVRVYRVDPKEPDKIAGQVEAMDCDGARSSFAAIGELAEVLRQPAAKRNEKKKLRGKK